MLSSKAITYAIADRARTIRIPVDVVAAIEKVKMVARRLAHDLGREPSPRTSRRACACRWTASSA